MTHFGDMRYKKGFLNTPVAINNQLKAFGHTGRSGLAKLVWAAKSLTI